MPRITRYEYSDNVLNVNRFEKTQRDVDQVRCMIPEGGDDEEEPAATLR